MFILPALPYDKKALEPVISRKIMDLHYDKHHAGYVKKLNDAVKGTEWAERKIENVLENIDRIPDTIRQAVINNGGGHANHSLFWTVMKSPTENNAPTQKVLDKIQNAYGSFETFKEEFSTTASGRFGSGWAWLVKTKSGDMKIYSTANQDSPYMKGDTPVLGLDVWEHAYYLDYLNDRGAYIEKWWNVVNWEEVEKKL